MKATSTFNTGRVDISGNLMPCAVIEMPNLVFSFNCCVVIRSLL